MGLKGSCPSVTARPGTRCSKLSLAPPYKKGNNGNPGRRDGHPGSLVFSWVTRGPVVRGRCTAWPRCQNLEPKRLPLSVIQEPPGFGVPPEAPGSLYLHSSTQGPAGLCVSCGVVQGAAPAASGPASWSQQTRSPE